MAEYGLAIGWSVAAAIGFSFGVGLALKVFDWLSSDIDEWEEIKKGNHSDFKRAILQCAYSKKELTYLENKILFTLAVLENEDYLNDNIEGRYFKKDFDFSSGLCTFRV